MTQGPGGPPSFGPPPHQPPAFGPPPSGPPGPSGPPPARPAGDGPTGTARLLALAAAGLGLLVYLLGFFGGGDSSGLSGAFSAGLVALLIAPLMLVGGLLAGASVLPKAGRVLLPGAIIALTGALLLLQIVAAGDAPGVVVFALIVAVLEAAAAIVAYLMDAGIISAPAGAGGRRQPAPQPGYGQPPGYGPPGGYGGPPAYGPPSTPGLPPAFGGGGAQPGAAPHAQPGWGPPPGPPMGGPDQGPRPSSPDADLRGDDTSATSATTAIPIVSGGDRSARPAEETNFFDDGGMFSKTAVSRQPAAEPAGESRPAAHGSTERSPDRAAAPGDETGAYGEGGMFAESTPRNPTSEPADEGRPEPGADGERRNRNGVPPNEQTWFMPPGDRPNNS
jgi:uncharacterized protein DUF5336